MKTEIQKHEHLDYVTGTIDWVETPIWDDWVKIDDHSVLRNYNRTITFASGMQQHYSTKQKNVGTHIVLTGDTLGVLRGEGFSDLDVISLLRGINIKFRRVDIAVTSRKVGYIRSRASNGRWQQKQVNIRHPFTPDDMLVSKHLLKSNLDYDNPVVDRNKNTETCYIGSRKARNRLFRAYDKGIELGATANTIIRYELETRKNSNGVIAAIEQGESISSIIRRYVDFDCGIYREIMGDDIAEMPQVEVYNSEFEKASLKNISRWHWLIESVSKTVAVAIQQDVELHELPFSDNLSYQKFIEEIHNQVNIKLKNWKQC